MNRYLRVSLITFGFIVSVAVFQNCSHSSSTEGSATTSSEPFNDSSSSAPNSESDKTYIQNVEVKFLSHKFTQSIVLSDETLTKSPGDLEFQITRLNASDWENEEAFSFDIRSTVTNGMASFLDNQDLKLFENHSGSFSFSKGEKTKVVKLRILSPSAFQNKFFASGGRVFLMKVFRGTDLVADRLLKALGTAQVQPGGSVTTFDIDLEFAFNPVRFSSIKVDNFPEQYTCALCYSYELKYGTTTDNDPNGNIPFFNYDQKLSKQSHSVSESSTVQLSGTLEPDFQYEYNIPGGKKVLAGILKTLATGIVTLDMNLENRQFKIIAKLSDDLSPTFSKYLSPGLRSISRVCQIGQDCLSDFQSETSTGIIQKIDVAFKSRYPDANAGNFTPNGWDMNTPVVVFFPGVNQPIVTSALEIQGVERYATLNCIACSKVYFKNKSTGLFEEKNPTNLPINGETIKIEFPPLPASTDIPLLEITSADGQRHGGLRRLLVQ